MSVSTHWTRRLAGVALCALGLGCQDGPGQSITKPDEFVDRETLTAISWLGVYDGWGEVTVGADTEPVRHLELRIAFDADSVKSPDCFACVTVTLEPWFRMVNVKPPLASELFLRYWEEDLLRTLAISRFSGAGHTANALLVTVNRELPGPPKQLLIADLEFRSR